ncbi:dihydroxyacetone kinase family protein [Streptomonospora litoralis]|uniref:PTS-dependent dihydroxyacetone kinase, dihydroxyacetone-binding subunit DhaK n=1 Tax=Streptomonospora litoralis TaxID=2498135 RepID=A0A4V0ZJN0_9ACTN|nr:dihydroxyacetone kinase family protein [Streptomonospora litoralis]QBI54052.1 PTS-dependent dihydroxyacetone kinase, dihydroxyacetone-binding subunit DhaK [Streptomonospora litoralis]
MPSTTDAAAFKSAWVEGLVTSYSRLVAPVPDAHGVMSTGSPEPGRVAVVIGGGCGHYPAFAGLVGPGLVDAAVIGDVFTSPSAEQVYRTARAVDGGAGVLFSYGNYAGDVMHFGLAARRLAAEGVDSRTVLVTDDVASGSAEDTGARRGVAGGFFVYRIAAAAAARGYDLDGVARVAARANAMTRTFGAAFGGCTLPGQNEPLFTVPAQTMELGLGIHGEPGLRRAPAQDPAGLADVLVDTLLPELGEAAGKRAAVLLNGLGRTPYEDLFICYSRVHRRLAGAGVSPHRPEVGEFVTSLDMAGLSLSVMILDDELADLYGDPCQSPAFTATPAAEPAVPEPRTAPAAAAAPSGAALAGADHAAQGGGVAAEALAAALAAVEADEQELGRLDAVAGDGDHGQGMVRGLRAAVAAARTCEEGDGAESAGRALLLAGTALADAAGGASGALYGLLLAEMGGALVEAGPVPVTAELAATAVGAAFDAVCELGGGAVGEKTMLDALAPFRDVLAERARSGAVLADAWSAAAAAATDAARATADMPAKRGRAARLGERGKGHADAGATSLALMARAAAEVLGEHRSAPPVPDAAPTEEGR